MTTTEQIYSLAETIDEADIQEMLNDWKRKDRKKLIKAFNSLVRLGDPRPLAMATVIDLDYNTQD